MCTVVLGLVDGVSVNLLYNVLHNASWYSYASVILDETMRMPSCWMCSLIVDLLWTAAGKIYCGPAYLVVVVRCSYYLLAHIVT